MGIIGFIDTVTALSVPGVELVSVCDLYDGRLERAKEVFGKQIKMICVDTMPPLSSAPRLHFYIKWI